MAFNLAIDGGLDVLQVDEVILKFRSDVLASRPSAIHGGTTKTTEVSEQPLIAPGVSTMTAHPTTAGARANAELSDPNPVCGA